MRGKQENKNALVGFLVCATGALFVLVFGRWHPRADFDVTGTLWLMQNILPLIVLCVLLVGATGAFVVWLKSKLAKE